MHENVRLDIDVFRRRMGEEKVRIAKFPGYLLNWICVHKKRFFWARDIFVEIQLRPLCTSNKVAIASVFWMFVWVGRKTEENKKSRPFFRIF